MVLGACGRSGNGPVATSSVHQSSTSTERVATACATSQLKVVLGIANGAMGHIGQEVHLQNTSTSACTLSGYPSLQLIDGVGKPLATHITDGSDYIVPRIRVRTVTLAPNGAAAFLIGYADATGYGSAQCPKSSSVKIYPPHLTSPLIVAWHLQPYGGATIATLRCGEITVSPVAPVGAIKW